MTLDAEMVKKIVKRVLIGLVVIGGVVLLAKAVSKGDIDDEIESIEDAVTIE
jgi:hypothetical protein